MGNMCDGDKRVAANNGGVGCVVVVMVAVVCAGWDGASDVVAQGTKD